ncbi:RloB family protein, partial [Persicitalea sp.]|uniref:RloB family protein n=1 Tax=Persicitalea sp. TaxID=3100273 RepID=UPI003593389B
MSKNSRKQNPYGRRRPTRLVRESYLILCEGRNTEPEYFNAFRLSTATVRALPVTSGDAMAVVLAAIKRRNAETNKGKLYDHYWVVFDKDATPDSKFNAAIALAEAEGLQVAYSNQAFELWFLLHFDYVSGSMHRNLYADRLTTLLKFPYEKKPESVKLVFKALFDKQIQAIENARRLLDEY